MPERFSNQLVAELYQPFWASWQAGEFLTDAAAVAGTDGRRPGLAAPGRRGAPRRGRDLKGRYLSFAEREEIALGRAAGESMRGSARGWAVAPRRSRGSWAATPTVSAGTRLPGTGRWAAARGFPRPAGDVGVDRDDLSVAVRAVARGAAPRADEVSAHRTSATDPEPVPRAGSRCDRKVSRVAFQYRPAMRPTS
jgi:hypothetical protein